MTPSPRAAAPRPFPASGQRKVLKLLVEKSAERVQLLLGERLVHFHELVQDGPGVRHEDDEHLVPRRRTNSMCRYRPSGSAGAMTTPVWCDSFARNWLASS